MPICHQRKGQPYGHCIALTTIARYRYGEVNLDNAATVQHLHPSGTGADRSRPPRRSAVAEHCGTVFRFSNCTPPAQDRRPYPPVCSTQARRVEEIARADTLLDQVHDLLNRASAITDQAEKAGDLRTALQGIREVRGVLELLARVTGELQNGGTSVSINLVNSPQWQELRARILNVLVKFPDAREALVKELSNNED